MPNAAYGATPPYTDALPADITNATFAAAGLLPSVCCLASDTAAFRRIPLLAWRIGSPYRHWFTTVTVDTTFPGCCYRIPGADALGRVYRLRARAATASDRRARRATPDDY